jgi:hypothetical protein
MRTCVAELLCQVCWLCTAMQACDRGFGMPYSITVCCHTCANCHTRMLELVQTRYMCMQTPWPQAVPCCAERALGADVSAHFLDAAGSQIAPDHAAQQSVSTRSGACCWAVVQAKADEDDMTAALALHASSALEQSGTCGTHCA